MMSMPSKFVPFVICIYVYISNSRTVQMEQVKYQTTTNMSICWWEFVCSFQDIHFTETPLIRASNFLVSATRPSTTTAMELIELPLEVSGIEFPPKNTLPAVVA